MMSNTTEVIALTSQTAAAPPTTGAVDIVMVTFFGVICILGLFGNGLVMWAILRYRHMRTVSNWFIFNLSIAYSLFLLGLPLAITTALTKEWVFGDVMCRIYFIETSINQVTGAFTLTMMSLDRFIAVCFPLAAINLRNMRYAGVAIAVIWLTSLLFISPIVLFAQIADNGRGGFTCTVVWPSASAVLGSRIYTTYTLLLSFAVPVALICVFYALIVARLRRQSAVSSNKNRKDQTTKVTKLVGLVISVFVGCWLPFLVMQIYLIVNMGRKGFAVGLTFKRVFQAFTVLSYANSAINPLIYAFNNHQFRATFKMAFGMQSADEQLDGRSRAPENITLMTKGGKEECDAH